jgi:predicted metalloprotease
MRWAPGQRSEDLEDRREESGVGGGLRLPGGRLGLGGALVVLALSLVFRQDLFAMLDTGPVATVPGGAPTRSSSPEEEKLVGFVSFVLDDVQATWAKELPGAGRDYRRAKLVLFRDAYPSGCGEAEAATGPFYCPADEKVYIDLGFYDDLKRRFGAPGEFAQAYVIAHELGHHVQNVLGVNRKVRAAQEAHPAQANALSVRLELQADCLAGVWGHSTDQRHLLESGDVEAGLAAAAAVGDDRLQRMGGGRVNPESWTHGSAQQRVAWFRRGLQSGAIGDCDTFSRTAP